MPFYGQKSCYKQEVRPVGFRVATSNSVNRLWILWSVNMWTKPDIYGGASNLRSYLDRANLIIDYQKLKRTDRTLDPFY